MKKLIILSALVAILPFLTSGAYVQTNTKALQNRINFNQMLTTYPELREANIKLVPVFSSDLDVCEGEVCTPRISTYHVNTDTIFIQKDLNPFIFQYWVIHEYCHHISYTEMENWQWKKWVRLYNEYPTYVSEYSKTNPSEGWAEFCSVYKFNQRDTKTYSGVEMLFDSPQAKFADTIFPRYRKPL